MTELTAWQNFYVIVGSSAGALIGLQFVVLSLVSEMRGGQIDPQGGGAYATPTIVHFATVLGFSAILSAPWNDPVLVTIIWGLVGVGGLIYIALVIRRMRAQSRYRPEFEDWLFHVLLPFAAYLILAVTAYTARFSLRPSLFGVAAATLLLLFSGIHNAWDAVTYHVFKKAADPDR
ncbi:MAG TPA: hypothetical protein VKT49_17670 [Bryobacteraceae bacterium]|nr:hypothetical protein [Bryobacteraceae bacterium]